MSEVANPFDVFESGGCGSMIYILVMSVLYLLYIETTRNERVKLRELYASLATSAANRNVIQERY